MADDRFRARWRSAAALGAAAVLVSGCSSAPPRDDTSASATSTSASSTADVAPPTGTGTPDSTPTGFAAVPEALNFTAEDIAGEPFSGADVAGTDTVFWFWAPWCSVCARSAEGVRAAADQAEGVTFVGVAGLSADGDDMRQFVDRNGLDGFRHIADVDGSVYTRFGISQQHSFVLVDAEGSVESVTAYGRDLDLPELIDQTFG